MNDILSKINVDEYFVYLPLALCLIQFIGFILLYINTYFIGYDKNAKQYYAYNVSASVLVSIPLLVFVLGALGFLSIIIINKRKSLSSSA
jgi:uncharacterized membrane protein